jgi:hypothetical protein
MYNNTSLRAMIAQSTVHAGIDKLMLTTREFSVSSDLDLAVKPFVKLAGQDEAERDAPPLYRVGSKPRYGEGAFLNTEQFNLSINRYGLQLVVNPSKILHPYELLTKGSELNEVMLTVQSLVGEKNVHLDVTNMLVARLDIAKQATMPRKVADYSAAFDQMKMKGTRSVNVNHGAQTFSIRNDSVEASFYDKAVELKMQKFASDFMRAELRLRKGATVKNYAGVKTFEDLVKMDADGYTYVYNNWMKGKLFNSQPEQMSFDFAGLDAMVQTLVEKGNGKTKGNILNAATVIGARTIFDDIGIDRFLQAFEPYYNGSTLRRAKIKLKQLATMSAMIDRPINTLTLIDELRTIFLQAA